MLSREKVTVCCHKFIKEETAVIFFECYIKSFQDVILEGRKIGHEANTLLLVTPQLADVTFYQASFWRAHQAASCSDEKLHDIVFYFMRVFLKLLN